MNKCHIFITILISILFIVSSCKKDKADDEVDPKLPNIVFVDTTSYLEMLSNQEFSKKMIFYSGYGLKEINIFKVKNNIESLFLSITQYDTTVIHNYSLNYKIQSTDFITSDNKPNSKIQFKLKVIDKRGNNFEKTLFIKLKNNNIRVFNSVTLGAKENTIGGFFSTITSLVYDTINAPTNSAVIDFVYDSIAVPKLYSPEKYPLKPIIGRNTKFYPMVSFGINDFKMIKNNDSLLIHTYNMNKDKIFKSELEIGVGFFDPDYILIITHDNKIAILGIEQLVIGSATTPGSLTFSLKIQE